MKNVRDLDYFLSLPYRIVLTPDPEGGYSASVPDLPGCLSQGETADEACSMIREAMSAWISSALENGETVPEPTGEYSGRILIRVSRSLHRELVTVAQEEGISLNQFINIQLGRAIGRRMVTA